MSEESENGGPYVLATRERNEKVTLSSVSKSSPHDRKWAYSHVLPTNENLGFMQWTRYQSGLLVRNRAFQNFIICMIIFNSITMGIGTFDFVTEDPDMEHLFELSDQVFLIIFTSFQMAG